MVRLKNHASFFKLWKKGSLLDILYGSIRIYCKGRFDLFQQSDKVSHLYFLLEGEFELTVKQPDESVEKKPAALPAAGENKLINPTMHKLHHQKVLCKLAPNQFVGENDVMKKRKSHTHTCRFNSLLSVGVAVKIPLHEFMIRLEAGTRNNMLALAQTRDEQIRAHLGLEAADRPTNRGIDSRKLMIRADSGCYYLHPNHFDIFRKLKSQKSKQQHKTLEADSRSLLFDAPQMTPNRRCSTLLSDGSAVDLNTNQSPQRHEGKNLDSLTRPVAPQPTAKKNITRTSQDTDHLLTEKQMLDRINGLASSRQTAYMLLVSSLSKITHVAVKSSDLQLKELPPVEFSLPENSYDQGLSASQGERAPLLPKLRLDLESQSLVRSSAIDSSDDTRESLVMRKWAGMFRQNSSGLYEPKSKPDHTFKFLKKGFGLVDEGRDGVLDLLKKIRDKTEREYISLRKHNKSLINSSSSRLANKSNQSISLQ